MRRSGECSGRNATLSPRLQEWGTIARPYASGEESRYWVSLNEPLPRLLLRWAIIFRCDIFAWIFLCSLPCLAPRGGWNKMSPLLSGRVILALTLLLTVHTLAPNASASTFNVLHEFEAFPEGAQPEARLVADASGNLYGTTTS